MKKRIIVEFLVDDSELVAAREKFHEGKPLSDAIVFADDLQENAYDGGGTMHGHFKVLSVEDAE